MADILAEIMSKLPKEVEISLCNFEGANIIVYTKDKDFFLDNKGKIWIEDTPGGGATFCVKLPGVDKS